MNADKQSGSWSLPGFSPQLPHSLHLYIVFFPFLYALSEHHFAVAFLTLDPATAILFLETGDAKPGKKFATGRAVVIFYEHIIPRSRLHHTLSFYTRERRKSLYSFHIHNMAPSRHCD